MRTNELKGVRNGLMTIVLVLTSMISANAQMQPAKPIPPKVIKGVALSATPTEVWKFIASPALFYGSMKEVKDLKCPGSGLDAQMTFVLPDDNKRLQTVSVFKEKEMLLAYFITQSAYSEQAFVYRLTVGQDENKAFVQFEGIFNTGDKAEDSRIEKLVVKEWDYMKRVLEEQFNKTR